MFLPEMEKENRILEQEITNGQVGKYNIEIEEQDEAKPVIEMVMYNPMSVLTAFLNRTLL